MSDEARVSMVWPADLKEAVRTRVGGRGLTVFTVEAVRSKLGLHDEHLEATRELNEVKDLVQRLADRIALASDYEDPEETLRELDLPPWVDTTGWPGNLARAINPEESAPEPVVEKKPEPAEDDEDLHKPMFLVKPKGEAGEGPAIGDPESIVAQDLPHDHKSNDLWERIQAKALEKGVNLSEVPMKKGSEIEKPEPKPVEPEPEVASEPASDLQVQTDVATEVAPEEPSGLHVDDDDQADETRAEGKCPTCGSQLIAGECWECM